MYTPRPFRTAWWLPGAHAQTIVGRWLRRRLPMILRRERITTPDGDFVDLDWPPGNPPADAPLVLVVHGLEGSATSGYVLQMHRALAARGIRSVGLNLRSCSGEPNLLPRFYHAGDTDDLAYVAGLLAERYPDALLGATGFSLGANIVLKWLGEIGADCPVRAAVAVSVPFDLTAGARALDQGLGPVYGTHFLRGLQRKLNGRAETLADRCDIENARSARSLREFDDAVTARLHGFRGVDDYYTSCSSARFLDGIRVPTLLIHAADDPFLPPEAIPVDAPARNPSLTGAWSERGGHVGFVAGSPWAPEFWAESEAARFLAAAFAAAHAETATTNG